MSEVKTWTIDLKCLIHGGTDNPVDMVLKFDYDVLKAKLEKAEKVISFYADMDSWRTTDGHKKYSTIDDDDLGTGEFEQPTGPNHFMNSVSDLDNGGRRAREYLRGEG